MRVATCLWTNGGDLPRFSAGVYDESYVDALRRGLARHWPQAELEVLRDEDFAERNWPGWWRRFEAFRPEFWPEGSERLVLLDLDQILVGDCSWLGEWSEAPVGLPRDPFFPDLACSTIISVDREGAELLWKAATTVKPTAYQYMGAPSEMALLRTLAKRHGWAPLEPEPKKLLSYKVHVLRERMPWEDASIVYFHGKPKPADLKADDPLRLAWQGLPVST